MDADFVQKDSGNIHVNVSINANSITVCRWGRLLHCHPFIDVDVENE